MRALSAALLLCLAAPLWGDVPEVVRQRLEAAERDRAAGELESALARYREIVELEPGLAEGHLGVGGTLHAMGRFADALAAFVAGLAELPGDRTLAYNAIAEAVRLRQAEPAVELAERAVGLFPKDAELSSLLSRAYKLADRGEEALRAAERAAGQAPRDARLLFELGNLYHEAGNAQQAIDSFRRAIRVDRNYLRAQYNLGAVLYEVGDFEGALEAYEVALRPVDQSLAAGEQVPALHARAYLNLGGIYQAHRDWHQALAAYGKAARLDPGSALAHYNLGFVFHELGRLAESEEEYQQALGVDAELPMAYLHLGEMRLRADDPTAAVRWLRLGLERRERLDDEAKVTALGLLGRSLAALGDNPAAITAYRQLLEARPHQLEALLGLGRLLRREGSTDEAREILERARAVDPANVVASLEVAALASDQDSAAAIELYRRLVAEQGNRYELWPVRANLALLLLREDQRAAARQELEALLALLDGASTEEAIGPPDPLTRGLLYTLYGVLEAEGQRSSRQGDAALQNLLREVGDLRVARVALALLEAREGDLREVADTLEGLTREGTDPFLEGSLGLILWMAGRNAAASPHLSKARASLPDWGTLDLALGEIVLAEGDEEGALEHLRRAEHACGRGESTFLWPGRSGGTLPIPLGTPRREQLCQRVRRLLGEATVVQAGGRLAGALDEPTLAETARRLQEALRLPLAADVEARARLLLGTVRLQQGLFGESRAELERAVAGGLSPALLVVAQNNLGVSLFRLGSLDGARQALEAARRSGDSEPLFNLAVLTEQHLNQGREALELYRRYLAAGGDKRGEVQRRIDRLQEIYP